MAEIQDRWHAPSSPYLVPFDGSFRISESPTEPPPDSPPKKKGKKLLKGVVRELRELQRILYAHDHHSILLVFQAMDAAGKDGTIRAVMTGVNPAGCQVFSFKKPSSTEIDHDFLWRTSRCLPERGRIGIFNRSYYEEVLVVRVHPALLVSQRLPGPIDTEAIWKERFASIRDHEAHLARNGTVILKFWLNVSREEQRQRFLARLDEPEKNWKFAVGDVKERGHWDDYMDAYQDALNATSRPWAPWYAVPADDKPNMRLIVADVIVRALKGLDLQYPQIDEAARARFNEMRGLLEGDK
jgi:PPK2 family polyphosphate:nucleotide phosphotransferase